MSTRLLRAPVQIIALVSAAAAFSFAPSQRHLCSRAVRLHHAPRLSTQTAPPSPPPTITSDGGGGGDGDGDGEGDFLRLVAEGEADAVLTDWQSRSRIYKMTDNEELKERHSSALETIGDMLSRCTACQDDDHCSVPLDTPAARAPQTPRRLTLGLFGPEQVCPHALADAEIAQSGALVIKCLALNPVEYAEASSSTAALRILCGLRSLAETIGVPLDIEALKQVNKGRFWLAGMALLPAVRLEEDDCH